MGGNYIDKLNVIIRPVTYSYITGLPIKKIAHLIRISVAGFQLPSRIICSTAVTEFYQIPIGLTLRFMRHHSHILARITFTFHVFTQI